MKLKDNYITHMNGNQQIMIDVSAKFSGLTENNKTAAVIVDMLKTDTTEEKIVAAMLERYEVSEEILKKDVHDTINILRSIGAIDE